VIKSINGDSCTACNGQNKSFYLTTTNKDNENMQQ